MRLTVAILSVTTLCPRRANGGPAQDLYGPGTCTTPGGGEPVILGHREGSLTDG